MPTTAHGGDSVAPQLGLRQLASYSRGQGLPLRQHRAAPERALGLLLLVLPRPNVGKQPEQQCCTEQPAPSHQGALKVLGLHLFVLEQGIHFAQGGMSPEPGVCPRNLRSQTLGLGDLPPVLPCWLTAHADVV